MICVAYYSLASKVKKMAEVNDQAGAFEIPSDEEMEERFMRFKNKERPDPVHCLVQCLKLGEARALPPVALHACTRAFMCDDCAPSGL